jgi:pyridoxamine 5'-phosphate oxidase
VSGELGWETLTGDAFADLPEFDDPPENPIDLLVRWVERAREHQVREPLAFVLATVDSSSRPSTRTVLLKTVDKGGLVFGTYDASRKGKISMRCHGQPARSIGASCSSKSISRVP